MAQPDRELVAAVNAALARVRLSPGLRRWLAGDMSADEATRLGYIPRIR